MSQRCYTIDLAKKTMSKAGNICKPDRFSNHIFFRKHDCLYLFGELFLHIFNLKSNKWSKEVFPLNQSLLQ